MKTKNVEPMTATEIECLQCFKQNFAPLSDPVRFRLAGFHWQIFFADGSMCHSSTYAGTHGASRIREVITGKLSPVAGGQTTK